MKSPGYISGEAKATSSIRNRAYLSAKSSALIEITVYLAYTSLLALFYELNWINLKQAGMGILIQLLGLILLSWIRLDRGRHPCFFFLCLLPLFQAGLLIASAIGSPIDPYQIDLLALSPFDISSKSVATFLLALSVSAICIYAPCRWNYQLVLSNQTVPSRRGLTYLYMVFCITLPFAVWKNVLLFHYASVHGGYLTLFTQLDDMIASIPPLVRFISGIMTPAFLAIFVLESRKIPLYICTILYFLVLSIFLLIGSRGSTVLTILSLWCVSSIKTRPRMETRKKRSQLLQILALSSLMILIAASVGSLRDGGSNNTTFTLTSFIAEQGSTMNVTEIAIEYRDRFSPYAVRYFAEEIESAVGSIVAKDQSEYSKGQYFAKDATVFLDPDAYDAGHGIGGSYLGEAYIAGAIPGVIIVSLLLGFGFNHLYLACSTRFGLFLNALILPEIFWMLRGEIFGWVPALVRGALLVVIMFIGWKIYMQFIQIFRVRSNVVS